MENENNENENNNNENNENVNENNENENENNENNNIIILPEPEIKGSLMTILNNRHSERKEENDVSSNEISLNIISDILWCCYGNNRNINNNNYGSFKTVPSALSIYPLIIYISNINGIFKYNSNENNLNVIVKGDFRDKISNEDYVKNSNLIVLIFGDLNKYKNYDVNNNYLIKNWERLFNFDAALCVENIFLYCTENNLKCSINSDLSKENEIKNLLNLRDDEKENYKYIVSQCIN